MSDGGGNFEQLFPTTEMRSPVTPAVPRPSPDTGRAVSEPLASRMRPRSLDEYVGQHEIVGPDSPLRRLIAGGDLTSVVLWGPPGSGKTSLARVIAAHIDGAWVELSAVNAGVKDVRAVIEEARQRLNAGRRTVLFLDEIHRFNKGQQDALLPAVEAGWITLVGATTENPYFELNAPLMSRCRLVRLGSLTAADIRTILEQAATDPDRGYGGRVRVTPGALDALITIGDGDARAALNALETAVKSVGDRAEVDEEVVGAAIADLRYDRGDAHYDQISAFIKSIRGSDPDAAMYWLFRMLKSGEDPLFIARRLLILASEDVGMADRDGLPIAIAAYQAVERIGLPEAEYHLAHATIALSMAAKSNSVARAMAAAKDAVDRNGNLPVPLHLRDAHSRAGRALGHGDSYDYPHRHPGGWVAQQYLPDDAADLQVYEPSNHGDEAAAADRIAQLRELSRSVRLRRTQARDRTDRDRSRGDQP
jgi:putative ATPase